MSGEELRRRRLALGLKQPELAAQLGIHQNTMCRWKKQGVPRLSIELAQGTLERLEQRTQSDSAYIVTDPDGLGQIVHAESQNLAIARYFDELGICLIGEGTDGLEVRRAEHLDGLPATDWIALSVGGFGSVECACGREIARIEGHLEAYDDNDKLLEPHLVGDELFCSAACAAELYAVSEGGS